MNNYIFITREGDPLPIADRLIDEGKTVIVGMTNDADDNGPPAKEKCRLSLYDGIIEKHDAEQVMSWMKKLPNKHEWFVMFDYGDLWKYSERALKMGFTKGIFPTEEGYKLEDDRKAGKKFAKDNFTKLKIAPVNEFKTIKEAIAFLSNEKDKIYVLKSNGSNADTVVPATQDPELARQQIIGALYSEAKGYQKEGFTLEQKILNPVELSPVMVFWEGKPLFSLIELENKPLGSGNIGVFTGGNQNLTLLTRLDSPINKIAFPPAIYEMAKKQPGIGIYDAGLLYDGKEFYFTEFCSQRWGWDGIFSEIAMCADDDGKNAVSNHFDLISAGKNPIRFKFGAALRLFQTEVNSKFAGIYKDGYSMDWMDEVSDDIFLYCMKKIKVEGTDKMQFVSVGYDRDLLVAVGASNTIDKAIDMAYRAADGFAMNGAYYRPKFDFVSRAYPTSILNRYDFLTKSGLI